MVTAGSPLTWGEIPFGPHTHTHTHTLSLSLSLYSLLSQRHSVARFVQPPKAQVENVNPCFRTLNLRLRATNPTAHRMGMKSGRPWTQPQRNLHHNHNSHFHLICTSNSGDIDRLSQTYNTISQCSAQDFKTSRVSHCAALPQRSSWQTTTPLRHTRRQLPRTPGTSPSLSPPTIHF